MLRLFCSRLLMYSFLNMQHTECQGHLKLLASAPEGMRMCVNQLSQQFITPREVLWEMVILVSSFVHCLLLMRPLRGPVGGTPWLLTMPSPSTISASNVAFLQWLVLVIIQTLSKAETTNWKCLPLLSYCKCETLAFFLMCGVQRMEALPFQTNDQSRQSHAVHVFLDHICKIDLYSILGHKSLLKH